MICNPVLGSLMSKERTKIIAEMVQETSVFFSEVFMEDYFPSLKWLDIVFGSEGKLRRLTKKWDDLLEEIIEDHVRRTREEESKNTTDFLSRLLELQRESSLNFKLTRKNIKALLIDMFAAGIDTSIVTLEWSMAELVRNPKVMKKLQQELIEIAHGERIISEELLGKMSYLKAVIKEVLRLHPPAPLLIPRESSEDCQIQGYDIHKQTRILINAWALGRDEAKWEAPEDFWPERFLDTTVDYTGKDLHFIPFCAGRRICSGQQFSIADIELALANLMHHFNWKLPNGLNTKDLDMEEIAGLDAKRKQKLELVFVYFLSV